jgi:hypothetical protein
VDEDISVAGLLRGKRHKINLHCPVAGCRADKPHADDPIVQGLLQEFTPPERLAALALAAMAELGESICRDVKGKKLFAFQCRLRQPEELYIRALYALFIADDKELPHILCGAPPNSRSGLYKKVNEVVLEGNGVLEVEHAGLKHGRFTAMETLHLGAHVSFTAISMAIGSVRYPEYLPQNFEDKYDRHVRTYCAYLNHVREMFKAGKGKNEVLAELIKMHRPAVSGQQPKADDSRV